MKTKIVVFFEKGVNYQKICIIYKGEHIEIVNIFFCYLGIVFTYGGSSFETQPGQALKAILTLRNYLNNFKALSLTHIMD